MLEIKRRTLVIGLGGTGCLCVGSLKKALQEAGIYPQPEELVSGNSKESEAKNRIAQTPIRLLAIDLDPHSAKDDLRRASIRDEFHQLDKAKLQRAVRDLEYDVKGYDAWYPDMDRETIKMREAVTGAGQWRPLGRLSYCEDQKSIEDRIQSEVQALQEFSTEGLDTSDIDVYLVASTGGGTGSGLIVDTAFYLQADKDKGDSNIQLLNNAFLLLPDVFQGKDQGKRVRANTYALLKELRGFFSQVHGFDMYYPAIKESRTFAKGKVMPFSNLYVFSNETKSTSLQSVDSCCEYMANLIFTRSTSQISQQVRSAMSNECVGTSEEQGARVRTRGGHVFSTCSSAVLEFPEPARIARAMAVQLASLDHADEFLADTAFTRAMDGLEKHIKDVLQPVSTESISKIWSGAEKELHKRFEELQSTLENNSKINPNQFLLAAEDLLEYIANLNVTIKDGQKAAILEVKSKLHSRLQFKGLFDASHDFTLNIAHFHALIMKAEEILASWLDAEVGEAPSNQKRRSDLVNTLGDFSELLEAKCRETEAIRYTFPFSPYIIRYKRLVKDLRAPLFTQTVVSKTLAGLESEVAKIMDVLQPVIPSSKDGKDVVFDLDLNARMQLGKALQEERQQLEQTRLQIEGWLKQIKAEAQSWKQDELGDKPLGVTGLNRFHVPEKDLLLPIKCCIKQEARVFFKQVTDQILYANNDEDFYLAPMELNKSLLEPLGTVRRVQFTDICEKFCSDLTARIKKGALDFDPLSYLRDFDPILEKASQNCFVGDRGADYVAWSLPADKKNGGYPYYGENDYKLLMDRVRGPMKRVFSGAPLDAPVQVDDLRVVILFESHRNPPEDIMNIQQHRDEYHNKFAAPLQLLHIHKDYARLFAGLFMKEIKMILCGNPDCSYNITHLPKEVQVCPSCDLPILSRCGNECKASTLSQIRGDEELNLDVAACKKCRQTVKTFTWKCDRHGRQVFDPEDRHCTQCIGEWRGKTIEDFADVSIRPRTITWPSFCINCKDLGVDEPFELPKEIAHLYYGVSDGEKALLKVVMAKYGIGSNDCPSCGAKLFPECPHGDEDKPHYTQLVDDHVVCHKHQLHKHKDVDVYECYHCRYPVAKEDLACPRCNKDLFPCDHCSHESHYLFSEDSLLYDRHCPECRSEVSKESVERKVHMMGSAMLPHSSSSDTDK